MIEWVTYYVVQPFYKTEYATIQAGIAFEVPSSSIGKKYADKLDDKFVGFILFSRSMCPWTGQYTDAAILGKFGLIQFEGMV